MTTKIFNSTQLSVNPLAGQTLPSPVPVLEALALLRATFEVGRPDLLGGDLYLRVFGPVGLFLVKLFHVVHLFKRTEVKQHISVNARTIHQL